MDGEDFIIFVAFLENMNFTILFWPIFDPSLFLIDDIVY